MKETKGGKKMKENVGLRATEKCFSKQEAPELEGHRT
jgi:hypothetical protein